MPEHPRLALGGRLIGCHIPLGPGMVKGVERADRIGCAVMQVFADNPTAWKRRAAPPKELPAFRARQEALGFGPLAVHAAYLINLAGADPDFWQRSVVTLIAEMRMGGLYGAASVVVHMGSHRGSGFEAGAANLGRGLARVLEAVPAGPDVPRLVLEDSAGGGDGIGGTLEELEAILEAAARQGADPSRIAFCLDTAHLWGAGYDLSDPKVLDQVLAGFDARLGPERLAMMHLNDSKAALGSHVDRHEHLGAGGIGVEGMRHLVSHPRLAAVPTYLETPGMDDGFDALNMERVRLLMAGAPLPALEMPAQAKAGGRARRGRRPTVAAATGVRAGRRSARPMRPPAAAGSGGA